MYVWEKEEEQQGIKLKLNDRKKHLYQLLYKDDQRSNHVCHLQLFIFRSDNTIQH